MRGARRTSSHAPPDAVEIPALKNLLVPGLRVCAALIVFSWPESHNTVMVDFYVILIDIAIVWPPICCMVRLGLRSRP